MAVGRRVRGGCRRFTKRARLPRGTYELSVRAMDRIGNTERRSRSRAVLVRRLR